MQMGLTQKKAPTQNLVSQQLIKSERIEEISVFRYPNIYLCVTFFFF